MSAIPLPWQSDVWDGLNRRIEQGRMAHALLISGDSGIGKMRLAEALAQRLICSAEMIRYACGACKACWDYWFIYWFSCKYSLWAGASKDCCEKRKDC